jgi:diketogulonate reductase-like aldo/keto reductase
MINPKDIFPIGIGTWGIGGHMLKDPAIDLYKQETALIHMLKSGMNFMEANAWYSEGQSVSTLAKAYKSSGKKRSEIFVCQAVYVKDKKFDNIEKEVESVLKLFDTDYIDSFQFTTSVFTNFGFERCVKLVDKLITKKITRYTSITNESMSLLEKYHKQFGDKLFSHEVAFTFENRENETDENGPIPYARNKGLKTVVFQPLRRNRTALRNWRVLVELSNKYNATQNQIILAWILSKGFLPLTKSETTSHIDENIASLGIKLEKEDLRRLEDFRVKDYKAPKIDWGKTGVGEDISQLPNIFDEEYDKQSQP